MLSLRMLMVMAVGLLVLVASVSADWDRSRGGLRDYDFCPDYNENEFCPPHRRRRNHCRRNHDCGRRRTCCYDGCRRVCRRRGFF
ncbi:hypothetical protein BV898_06869 [Hypsibius exemplaris]|uniref:WAP domain-containing protein n=1 Tax=Hypsibius exemplaris TaxID=2072580 RepID=A0A1W0WUY1_HYPEX|nr:hypothetical protein BV898_06869 [Hypsibius exemplaris]